MLRRREVISEAEVSSDGGACAAWDTEQSSYLSLLACRMWASRDLKYAAACGSWLRPTTSGYLAASPSQGAGRVGSRSLAECLDLDDRTRIKAIDMSRYGELFRVKRVRSA